MHACINPLDNWGPCWSSGRGICTAGRDESLWTGTTPGSARHRFRLGRLFEIAAAIWFIKMGLDQMGSNRTGGGVRAVSANTSTPEKIKQLVRQAAERHGIREDVLLAICKTESSFTDPRKVGAAGEIGPLQVTPPAMIDLGHSITLNSDLDDKIETGARWMKHLLDQSQRLHGSAFGIAGAYTPDVYRLAIRAYNAGFHGAAQLNRGYEYLQRVAGNGARWLWV